MGLLDDLRRLYADAEVSLVGGRDDRAEAERAMAAGDPYRARAAAHRVLERAPKSPIGLALLADACEAAGLDAELEDALGRIGRFSGASADVWLRLGRVRLRVGASHTEVREALRRVLSFDLVGDANTRWAVRTARLMLADLELEEGSPARAEGWLSALDDDGSDVTTRKLRVAVERRDLGEVDRRLSQLAEQLGEADVADGATQHLIGRACMLLGRSRDAVIALARANILGVSLAFDDLRTALSQSDGSLDASALRAAETVSRSLHQADDPWFRAALDVARGDVTEAAKALHGRTLVDPAHRQIARSIAVSARNPQLLAQVASTPLEHALIGAGSPETAGQSAQHVSRWLDALGTPDLEPSLVPWVEETVSTLVARMLPEPGVADWDVLTGRLADHARALSDLDGLRKIEVIANERARPLRLAIVGEFNAGKSTFINAVLGSDVAPTGILPTTAVAHALRYGQDPIARARLISGGARTVPPERLKSLLKELGDQVREVDVEMPLTFLQRIEIIDTPGFNAPDPAHAKTAMATLVDGAGVDLALWLFDLAQPLKTSERRVLEAIAKRGLPILAILNKRDRLGGADLKTVLETFARDAAEIQLKFYRPVLDVSARLAVQARVSGDVVALEASGFLPVRALLEEDLPAHADDLKERALRRRALDVVAGLLQKRVAIREDLKTRIAQRDRMRAARIALATLLEHVVREDLSPDSGEFTDPQKAGRETGEVHGERAKADAVRRHIRADAFHALNAARKEQAELAPSPNVAMRRYLERRISDHLEALARSVFEAIQASENANHAATTSASKPLAMSEVLDRDGLWDDVVAVSRGFAAGGPEVIHHQSAAHDVDGNLLRAVCQVHAARIRRTLATPDPIVDPLGPRERELLALETRLSKV